MENLRREELKNRAIVNHDILSEKISSILLEISKYCVNKLHKCKSCKMEKYQCLSCNGKSLKIVIILENIMESKQVDFLEYIDYPDNLINLLEYFMLMNDLRKIVDFYCK